MAEDITYAKQYLSTERDQYRAMLYELLKRHHGEGMYKAFDELQNVVLNMELCGGLFPVKEEYRIWKDWPWEKD